MLAKKLGCPWISTGEILRAMPEGDFKKDMGAGRLVSDDTILPLVEKELAKNRADSEEVILDGGPRNITQAEWIDARVKAGKFNVTAVIHLVMDKELALQRMKDQGRTDSSEEAMNRRFDAYQSSVLPALDYLKKLGYKVLEVDATGTIEEVEQKVDKALGVVANA